MSASRGRSLSLFEAPSPEPKRGSADDPHLEAARRLARRIRRLPDHSTAQVAAGQALCRHLLAMLRAADAGHEERASRH